jgi:hypothetical protein
MHGRPLRRHGITKIEIGGLFRSPGRPSTTCVQTHYEAAIAGIIGRFVQAFKFASGEPISQLL